MSARTSLWGAVAERYQSPTELRAGDLGGRFTLAFRGATIVITKSNGVERFVDFDEFRAAWRTMAAGGSDESLRRITGNVAYLRAMRDDLISSGIAPDAETSLVSTDDLNSGEARLLESASPWAVASDIDPPALGKQSLDGIPKPDLTEGLQTLATIEALLDQERSEKDAALRENARLVASLEVLDERLKQEEDRASRLEASTVQTSSSGQSAAPGAIGAKADVPADLLAVAEKILGASNLTSDLRKAAETAVDLARRDPASAAAKARVVTELLVRREWATVFDADAGSTRKSFNDYARELDGNRSVNGSLLAVKRTLHRVANPGAHELEVSPRLAALIVLVLVSILDTESR